MNQNTSINLAQNISAVIINQVRDSSALDRRHTFFADNASWRDAQG
ncbi:hypothetical protein LN650_00035 [Klebsiella pneumoniae subsp. pneumoniae]|nr:hypothetical protein [Klebsiella pneumoniae subsp. pneumoniae]